MFRFEQYLVITYEIRTLGEFKHFLGIRIVRNRIKRLIWLYQDTYIRKICRRFYTSIKGKYFKIFIPVGKLLRNQEAENKTRISKYKKIVGFINYAAVVIRPNIFKVILKLLKYLANPTTKYLRYAQYLLEYFTEIPYFAIKYRGDLNHPFTIASDAAYSDHDDRTSSQGYITIIFGGAVDWKATKQNTVITSSTKAELLAISYASKELISWNRFFTKIKFDTELPNLIYKNNRQTIRIL